MPVVAIVVNNQVALGALIIIAHSAVEPLIFEFPVDAYALATGQAMHGCSTRSPLAAGAFLHRHRRRTGLRAPALFAISDASRCDRREVWSVVVAQISRSPHLRQ